MARRFCDHLIVVVLGLSSSASAETLQGVTASRPHLRRPVAVERVDDSTAVVANRRGRTLSVIDVEKLAVMHEYRLQGNPTDIDARGRSVLVTMTNHPRLASISLGPASASVDWELRLPTYPVSVRIAGDRKWASVCCLWARKVVFVRLPDESSNAKPKIDATVTLPFAPRAQLLLDDSRLLVADAFGGRLAVIDVATHKLVTTHSLPAQNIRGLARSHGGKRVFITHQLLNELSPPRRSEIIWGVMMSDAMRVLRTDKLVDAHADVLDGSRFVMIGNGTRGAGDPGALVVDKSGRAVITLGGTSEVAVVEPDGITVNRAPIGRRPVALAAFSETRYIVASELSDSISRIELPSAQVVSDTKGYARSENPSASKRNPTDQYNDQEPASDKYGGSGTYGRSANSQNTRIAARHLQLGTAPRPGAAERGELHFFDARLSAGGWYSCHSCHTDGHTSGSLADTLGDGAEGAPKRILSLLGAAETGPWSWLGNKARLNDQIHQSLRLTMRGRQLKDNELNDLIAFLKTLEPPPPFQPATSDVDRQLIERGRKLFASLQCSTCHEGRTLTSPDVYDVGLKDALGTKEFNPPSLRGVGHRYRLFHDNRASNVDAVVREHKHQLPRTLKDDEARALIRYLKSL